MPVVMRTRHTPSMHTVMLLDRAPPQNPSTDLDACKLHVAARCVSGLLACPCLSSTRARCPSKAVKSPRYARTDRDHHESRVLRTAFVVTVLSSESTNYAGWESFSRQVMLQLQLFLPPCSESWPRLLSPCPHTTTYTQLASMPTCAHGTDSATRVVGQTPRRTRR